MRLNKYLASVGVASRRKVDELIKSGEIKVNGKTAVMGQQVDPEKDVIEAFGKKIGGEKERVYLMMNKPAGVVSTLFDPQGRKTVATLLPLKERVYPIGRLDYETTGLLLFTNDGELAYRLTHPKFEAKKTYHLLVAGRVAEERLSKMRSGVKLSDGLTSPAEVRILEENDKASVVEMMIHEGRKREIRRICEALSIPLLELKRVAFDGVVLGNLPLGKIRKLSEEETMSLKKSVKLDFLR